MIQQFPLAGHPEIMVSRVLDILQAMNERMDTIQQACAAKDYDKDNDDKETA